MNVPHSDIASPKKRLGRWLGVAHRVGSDLCYWVLNNNGKVLVHTTVQYVVQDDCDNPEINLKIDKFNIDVSPELGDELANRYQQFIGILRWAVELGRIDITTEVSMMALHNALPRVGHLEALYHMFSYLSKHDCSNLVFDDQDPNITDILFPQQDWTEFYGDMKEAIP